MKIAVNSSEILKILLEKDPELPVHYTKAPTRPFPDCWEQFHPIQGRKLLPHLAQPGVIALGHSNPELRFNKEIVQRVLAITNFPYLSTHLEAKIEYFPEIAELQHLNHFKVKMVLKEHYRKVIQSVRTELKIPLVLENFPYYSWWHHFRVGSDPEFITEVCEETNCGFLLDIAHARCSAWHMGKDIAEYIEALPLKRLKEIHIAGVRMREQEGLRDTHTMPEDEDFQLLEMVLTKAWPEIITIEYGGMPEKIQNINRVYEPLSRNNSEELLKIIRHIQDIIKVNPI